MKKKTQKKKSAKKSSRSKTSSKILARPQVGVFAPAAPLPLVELQMNAERAQAAGVDVVFHPQIEKIEGLFAGSDADRALAFLDYAYDPDLDVLWCGRGGYGCVRILPILDEIVAKVGIPPKKTLVGYSDLTILLDYVAQKWGWRVIHAPMPATEQFFRVHGKDFDSLIAGIKGAPMPAQAVTPLALPRGFQPVEGKLVGGNLATLVSVIGTPYQMALRGKVVFIEEVGEVPYRIDRMIQQLILSQSLQGVKAIVLGTFTQCEDACPQVLKERPKKSVVHAKTPRIPLRPLIPTGDKLAYLFAPLAEDLGIPVFQGLNVGHGAGTGALELHRRVRLDRKKLTYL